MSTLRIFNLARVNAICLALVCPLLIRLWIEAVLWRFESGPQMLGFSLMHGGAGLLTPLVLLSLLVTPLYVWGGGLTVIAQLFPTVRPRFRGCRLVALGVGCVVTFLIVADAMQSTGLSPSVLVAGGVVLSVAVFATVATAVKSWSDVSRAL